MLGVCDETEQFKSILGQLPESLDEEETQHSAAYLALCNVSRDLSRIQASFNNISPQYILSGLRQASLSSLKPIQASLSQTWCNNGEDNPSSTISRSSALYSSNAPVDSFSELNRVNNRLSQYNIDSLNMRTNICYPSFWKNDLDTNLLTNAVALSSERLGIFGYITEEETHNKIAAVQMSMPLTDDECVIFDAEILSGIRKACSEVDVVLKAVEGREKDIADARKEQKLRFDSNGDGNYDDESDEDDEFGEISIEELIRKRLAKMKRKCEIKDLITQGTAQGQQIQYIKGFANGLYEKAHDITRMLLQMRRERMKNQRKNVSLAKSLYPKASKTLVPTLDNTNQEPKDNSDISKSPVVTSYRSSAFELLTDFFVSQVISSQTDTMSDSEAATSSNNPDTSVKQSTTLNIWKMEDRNYQRTHKPEKAPEQGLHGSAEITWNSFEGKYTSKQLLENALIPELIEEVEKVRQTESTVREIQALGKLFSEQVLEQSETIERVYGMTVDANDILEEANTYIGSARKRLKGSTKITVIILLVATFCVVFLDFVNK